jgi:hypothetical protein
LRNGVGTQMLMVSSFATAAKSVVARTLPASTNGLRTTWARPDIGFAAIDGIDL